MRKAGTPGLSIPDDPLILSRAKALYRTQVGWRRHLHKYPELSNQEFQTTQFVKQQLAKAGLRVLPLKLPTGVLAEISGSRPGPTVAIRSDLDALPIVEQSGLPFHSVRPGVMHACGHDVHMTTVLGVATILASLKKQFRGKVRFIFQPAEEVPPGGARPMIANGALKGVDMILGLHVDPHLPTGRIGLLDGAMMASVFDFDLIIKGKGGHAARPHLAVDAISVAAELLESIQKVVSRETDPMDPVVVSFGQIKGGTARNVVAGEVRLAGTARALSERAYKRIPSLLKRTVDGICRARGADFQLVPLAAYPVLRNHPAVNRLLARTCDSLFGPGRIAKVEPVLGGEDFACYLEKVPGAMLWLGVMNKRIKADKPWHSPQFIADEEAIRYGTAVLAGASLRFLRDGLS
ncbi:MAG: M20 family metallopeptidase [Candidatus Zixiibacteriota bacterium]